MNHTDLLLTCWKLTHPLQDPVLPSAVHQLLSLTSNAAMRADHPCRVCHKLTSVIIHSCSKAENKMQHCSSALFLPSSLQPLQTSHLTSKTNKNWLCELFNLDSLLPSRFSHFTRHPLLFHLPLLKCLLQSFCCHSV